MRSYGCPEESVSQKSTETRPDDLLRSATLSASTISRVVLDSEMRRREPKMLLPSERTDGARRTCLVDSFLRPAGR